MGSRHLFIVLVFSLLITASQGLAGTIQELLPGLLESHQRVKAAEDKTKAAEFLLKQSRAGYFPSLDFISETGYEDIYKENGPK